jgi:hypothetical protein
MSTGDEALLLKPVVNEYDALTSVGKVALGRTLVARDGYVEWRDGDRSERWTLPDQPAQSEVPVLASVIEADTWFRTLRGDAPERYVLLADEDGAALAVLALITTAAGPTYEQADFDRIWPEEQFDGLLACGVKRTRETYRDFAALNRAHPGTVATWRVILGSRASYWTGAALLAAAVVAVGVRVVAG